MQENISKKHISVLYNELIDSLNPFDEKQNIVLDGTLGLGGHAYGVINKLNAGDIFIGIDEDSSNLKLAEDRIKELAENKGVITHFINSNFANVKEILEDLDINNITFAYLDLGVSSVHFDEFDRGFSFRFDGPLDMRLNQSKTLTAEKIINKDKERELVRILKEYGEEPRAYKIAKAIISSRKQKKIKTTFDLRDIIKNIGGDGKTLARVFQAIRIKVNNELESIEEGLQRIIEFLDKEGILFVISFHSLEDRIVKNVFQEYSKNIYDQFTGQIIEFPKIKKINKKPLLPTDEETKVNPRSRSAKARIIQKL